MPKKFLSETLGSERRNLLLRGAVASTAMMIAPGAGNAQSIAEYAPSAGMLFKDLPTLTVKPGVVMITTLGWSVAGIGAASYVFDPTITKSIASANSRWMAITRNGLGFRLTTQKICADCFGLSAHAADNSDALQAAIDMCAMTGGGQISISRGAYRFGKSIFIKAEVELIGSGKRATSLIFDEIGVAIDARGRPDSRISFRMSDLTLKARNAQNTTQALRLGWNQRSTPLLERVCIAGFGHYAINFADSNWIVSFRDVEIHDCAKVVAGSSAIWRDPNANTVQGLADIKFFGLVIESCGNAKSKAGAIHFVATAPGSTQGLWLSGATIENNAGAYECAFENVDHLVIEQSYFEITFTPGKPHGAIEISGGRLNLTGCRIASDPANEAANIIRARNGAVLLASGNAWDSDFGGADVDYDDSITLEGLDFQRSGKTALRLINGKTVK
jgi:hypothetical protein